MEHNLVAVGAIKRDTRSLDCSCFEDPPQPAGIQGFRAYRYKGQALSP